VRLWHQSLISLLPRSQLLGQHRECAALRGGGWGKPHRTVDYVFRHPWLHLYRYHLLVMNEMERRGYRVDPLWKSPLYRGKRWPPREEREADPATLEALVTGVESLSSDGLAASAAPIYLEHDEAYLQKCLDNLAAKGIVLVAGGLD
jgi:uncharacterized protein (TIGR02328 family)